VHNKLGAGLTFNGGSVTVRINGVTISAGTDYTLTVNPADGDGFDIIINPDIFAYFDIDDEIAITYSAVLNPTAVIGVPGNMGEAVLEYSSDYTAGITDRTLIARTTVYTFDLDVYKYTGTLGNGDIRLANAEFELRTNPSNPATAIAFVLHRAGNAEDTAVYRHAAPTDTGVTKIVITPASGRLNLTGLDAGVYYLVETKAPVGYNRLVNPIIIEIIHPNGNGVTSLAVGGSFVNPQIVNVQNNEGPTLPSTGGIGTTIFTVIGLSLMSAAVIMYLCRRKPMTVK
jgi:LPXTG-motif cell wall-anchored protein